MADVVAGNTSTTASISVGSSVTGNLDFAGDADWFRIELTPGYYQFDLKGSWFGHGTLSDPYLYLHNSSGGLITANDDHFNGSSYTLDSRIFYSANGGTYYLSARDWGDNSTGTYTLFASRVNGAPFANDDALSGAAEDTLFNIDASTLLSNDTDPDGNPLSVTQVFNAVGGTVSLNGGQIVFTPHTNFNGAASFEYRAADNAGGSDTARVTFNVESVNDAPIAVADTGSTTEDAAILVDVLANDTDVDSGDTKTLVAADSTGAVGTVSIVNGQISYDPGTGFQSLQAGEQATDTFTYVAADSAGSETSATVTVTITGANDGPVAVADIGSVVEDESVIIDVLANDTDVDAGDTRTLASVDSAGAIGSVTIVDGKISYEAGAGFQSLKAGAQATDTFTYTMTDSAGAESTSTVIVTVTGANDAPVAMADTGSATEDGAAILVDVLANDTDVDSGDTKTLVSVDSTGTIGAISIVDGQLAYDPGSNFQSLKAGAQATDTFTYTMTDSAGVESTATAAITVTGINDAPTAVADTAGVAEDASILIDVLANDTDADTGDTKSLLSADVQSAQGASVSIENGVIRYTADADVFDLLTSAGTATDTFSYTMTDSAGVASTQTVTVTVNGVLDGASIIGTNQPDAGTTALRGSALDELIEGFNGTDELFGFGGADRLNGGNGDDQLWGGDGIDTLNGERGNDILHGEAGNDILTGGQGEDLFVFGSPAASTGTDLITDFKSGADHIRLANGVSITAMNSMANVNGDNILDTVLTLSNGGAVQLLGINGLSDWGVLLG